MTDPRRMPVFLFDDHMVPQPGDPSPAVVTLTGGNWRPSLGLQNLFSPFLKIVARSETADPDDTRFIIDLGRLRSILGIVIPGRAHNLSRFASYRFTVSQDGAFTLGVVTTGLVEVYPVVYPFGSLPWEHESWLDGRLEPSVAAAYPMPALHVWDAAIIARYILVELIDPTNPAGYVDVAKVMPCSGWRSSVGIDLANNIKWRSNSPRTVLRGGAVVTDRRDMTRELRIKLSDIPTDEALVYALEMRRRLDNGLPMFYVHDPLDAVHLHRRSLLAYEPDPGGLEQEIQLHQQTEFLLEEVIA